MRLLLDLTQVVCLLLLACGNALAWGCDGHQAVALIAQKHLSPNAAQQVNSLLSANPIDPALIRFCTEERDNLMANASTWADDVRSTAGTGNWHFIDIPLQVTSGSLDAFCEPVGPPDSHGNRRGCVVTAIAYNRNRLESSATSSAEKADALRYLIHLVGDLHQPLHASDNKDQGGNCVEVKLLDETNLSKLHAAWDTGLLDNPLAGRHLSSAAIANELNRKFSARKAELSQGDVSSWVWESHEAGVQTVYGKLNPPIPLETETGKTDCNAELFKTYALRIRLDRPYARAADRVIDEQIAKAGFRLAKVLNGIWP